MHSDEKTNDQRATHGSLIAEQLEKEIIDGTLLAGTKMDEKQIAGRFGVSRTPVREALMLLASRTLVERLPYRGVVVCDLSFERVEEMFEAMGEIEALCGRLAAGRMSISEHAALQNQHQLMQKLSVAGELASYEEANNELHNLIWLGAHNSDLFQIATDMRLKLAPFRRSQLLNSERMGRSIAEHEEIIQALITKESVTAEQLLRLHLLSSAKSFINSTIAARVSQGKAPQNRGPGNKHQS